MPANTNKFPINDFIIIQNEERHIDSTLESIKMCDEVIIVDSGSTDNTLVIAQDHGAKIYKQENKGAKHFK